MLLLLSAAALGEAPPAAPRAAATPSDDVFYVFDDGPITICDLTPRASPRQRERLPIRRSFEDRLVASAGQP